MLVGTNKFIYKVLNEDELEKNPTTDYFEAVGDQQTTAELPLRESLLIRKFNPAFNTNLGSSPISFIFKLLCLSSLLILLIYNGLILFSLSPLDPRSFSLKLISCKAWFLRSGY